MLQRKFFIGLIVCFLASFFYLSGEDVKPDVTLIVPMRDGTELPTDIYLPHPEAKNLPCILLRGPAGRLAPSATAFVGLAKAGYAVAIQDTRAATDKEGKTLPYFSDGWGKQQDGYDCVEWLAKHPLTNGKIGTLGVSNMGITQLLMAPTAPPSLKCQYIGVAASSLYHHAIFPGGQLLKNQVEGWLGLVARDPAVLEFVLEQEDNHEFWDEFNTVKRAEKVRVPGIHQGGWYDTFVEGTIFAFASRQHLGGDGAKGKQKLLIGPWCHCWPAKTDFGDFAVPVQGYQPPVDLGPLRWFDHYLKGLPNKIEEEPAVTYYVMGPFDGSISSGNVWRTSTSWPVPHKDLSYYLTANHKLEENSATQKESVMTYAHNIHDPVPTIGGRNLFLQSGPMDQRPIESRKDVVVFTTEPLAEDLEVTGSVIAKLVFSSDEDDTDLAVRLTDVYPDGKSVLIADALTRTHKIQPLPGKESKEVDVDLWSTSIVFAKGHRIRVIVSGSNFPRFEKNTASLDSNGKETVTHHLHVGGENGSRIVLPVVRKGDKWLASKD